MFAFFCRYFNILWFPSGNSHVQKPPASTCVLISFLVVVPSVLRTVSPRIISCLMWLRCSVEEIIPALLWFYYPHIHNYCSRDGFVVFEAMLPYFVLTRGRICNHRLSIDITDKLVDLLMHKGFNQGPWITGKQSAAESKHHSNRFWLDFAPPQPCLVWLSPHLSLMYVCARLFERTILTAGHKRLYSLLVE